MSAYSVPTRSITPSNTYHRCNYSCCGPYCGILKTEHLELKVADNLELGATAELDGLHRIQFRRGGHSERQRRLEPSSQHLDPARRPVPVSNDLRWSSTQSLSSIPVIYWFVLNRTQSLKLVRPYKFGASPSPGWAVFKVITNSDRCYSIAHPSPSIPTPLLFLVLKKAPHH